MASVSALSPSTGRGSAGAAAAASPSSATPSSSSASLPSLPPPTLLSKKRRWTIKHQLSQRHAHESTSDPSFFCHSKHVLVCSWSGRPIYTRYGDDSRLSAYMGVITALIENYRRIHRQQSIRSLRCGVWTVAFKLCGPIYLLALSRTGERVASLLCQLEYVHAQIVSVLTGQVATILQQRPQYDVRHLMTGTENLLSDLLAHHDSDYSLLLHAVHFLPLPRATRAKLGAAMKKGGKGYIYGALLSSTSLLSLQNNTKAAVSPRDLHLLINFLHNSQSLQSSESWTPICLPDFNATGYVYAYTSFLTDDLCLCLVSINSADIAGLKDSKARIVDALSKGRCMEEVLEGGADPYIDIHEIEGMGVGELLHMLYVQGPQSGTAWGGGSGGGVGGGGVGGGQLLQSHFAVPFHDTRGKRRLFRCYQAVMERGRLVGKAGQSGGDGAISLLWDVSAACAVLMVSGKDHVLLMALLHGVEKTVAINTASKILRWIKEANLFV